MYTSIYRHVKNCHLKTILLAYLLLPMTCFNISDNFKSQYFYIIISILWGNTYEASDDQVHLKF